MYSDLEYRKKVVVGLIMTLALLFFCAGVSIQQQKFIEATLQADEEENKENADSESQAEIERKPVDPNQPMIALTFDDGPGPGTERILEALHSHGARATFFMMGTRVNTYQDAVAFLILRLYLTIACHLTNIHAVLH